MRAYRTDRNQKDVVNGLRGAGYSVQHLHSVGAGCPDILVGAEGLNILIEIKDGDGKLTPDQVVWHATWKGQVAVVRSPEEAVELVKNAIEQEAEKKKKRSGILVAHNDTPQRGSGNSIAAGSARRADEVQGGDSDGRKLAHDSSEAKRGAGGRAKIWTRQSKPKRGFTGGAEGSGEE